LEVEGFISSRAGSGFFVCKDRDVADIQGRKLFEQLSQEYLAKIIALGFSEQDILDYLRSQAPTQISGKSSAKEINNGDD
jgi:DNA-binding transcriptional regulator YhcF (GntR family)